MLRCTHHQFCKLTLFQTPTKILSNSVDVVINADLVRCQISTSPISKTFSSFLTFIESKLTKNLPIVVKFNLLCQLASACLFAQRHILKKTLSAVFILQNQIKTELESGDMSISSILFHIMTFSLSNYRAIYIRLRDPFDKKNLSFSPPSSTAQQPPQTTQQQACYQLTVEKSMSYMR